MLKDFKQFVPSPVCLACDGCCRFKESDSRWRPVITSGEMKAAAHPGQVEKVFSPTVIGADHRIKTIPCADGHLCHFLNARENTCGIYHARPFDCQLYPFLLGREQGRIILYVHLNCPYIQEHVNTPAYQDYVVFLKEYFNKADVQKFLSTHPELISDYTLYGNEIQSVFVIAGTS